jgi:H+/Cl- antiporter ClcA
LRRGEPTDGAPGHGRVLGHRPERLPRTLAVAVVLGAFGGLVTVAFIRLLEWGQHRIWTDLPDALDVASDDWYFIFPVVIIGAVLLGLARRHLGEYPVSIEQALADHRRVGEFDRRHIFQAMAVALLSLWFGAALGPEAALTAILGGICSWVARVIDADTSEGSDLSWVGIGSAMGALFGTAGAAALTLDPRSSDVADARSGRLWRVIPAVLAAWAGLWVYRWLGTSSHYFDLGLPDYTFRFADLGWAMVVAVAAALAGIAFLALRRLTDALVTPLADRKVLSSVIGGLGLAALASWSSLVLFSGHEGTDDIIQSFGDDTVRFLLLLAGAKLLAAALLLSTGWKGGQFFPTMFAGAAIALAFAEGISGVAEVTALAAGMTGIVGVLLRRPVPAALLMVLFFPLAAWPAVLLGALIGSAAGKRLERHLAEG